MTESDDGTDQSYGRCFFFEDPYLTFAPLMIFWHQNVVRAYHRRIAYETLDNDALFHRAHPFFEN